MAGTTYKELHDVIDKIRESGYIEKKSDAGKKENGDAKEEEVVEEDAAEEEDDEDEDCVVVGNGHAQVWILYC